MCVEVFYGGKSVVAPLGDYTYWSSPPTAPGQAATIQPGGAWPQVAVGTAVRTGNTMVVDVPSFPVLSGDEPFVEVQYLPPGAKPLALNRLSGSVASSMFFFPTESTHSIWTYGHPWGAGDSSQQNPKHPWVPGDGKRLNCPPQPGDNVTHYPEIGPADEPGWKYHDADTPYKGDSKGNRVALFGIDDCFRVGYGHDDNANGKLDAGEVDHWISKCGFTRGQNKAGWDEVDGKYYWRHVNEKWPSPPRDWYTYIYDPITNKLKVYSHVSGLIYMGPPEGFWGWE